MAKSGWKQAPSNDEDGVAVVLEAATTAPAETVGLDGAGLRDANGECPRESPVVLAMILALYGAPARAAEPVTLRNGFAMGCDHLADVDSRVRLYLGAGETTTSR